MVSAPPSISPATDATIETSEELGSLPSGGRIECSRAASIDLADAGRPDL